MLLYRLRGHPQTVELLAPLQYKHIRVTLTSEPLPGFYLLPGVHTGMAASSQAAVWEMNPEAHACSIWDRGMNSTDQQQSAVRDNTDEGSIRASGAQLLQCQVGGVSDFRDPRIRDDLCPRHETVVLQGPSLCTKPFSQTHVLPQPCLRNTTCFPSTEVYLLTSLPIPPQSIVRPRMPLPT